MHHKTKTEAISPSKLALLSDSRDVKRVCAGLFKSILAPRKLLTPFRPHPCLPAGKVGCATTISDHRRFRGHRCSGYRFPSILNLCSSSIHLPIHVFLGANHAILFPLSHRASLQAWFVVFILRLGGIAPRNGQHQRKRKELPLSRCRP